MDTKRFMEARDRLEFLDEERTHKVRPRSGGSLIRPGPEELDRQLRELADYTLDLKDIVRELFEAIATPSASSR